MVAFAELDERVPFGQQLGQDDGPIVLFNTFHVAPDELDAFMEPWEPDRESIKRQPGYISTQLRRGIPGFVGIDMATGTPPTPIGEADSGGIDSLRAAGLFSVRAWVRPIIVRHTV